MGMKPEELFMHRAMQLAELGAGKVSPNPMVGCVVVHDDKIIGEGWHKRYGEAHAEVNAIESVEDKDLLQYASVYVNLEPCSHTGRTPPCADLLIKHKVKQVHIANPDPNPLVSGAGIKRLEEAGIPVSIGLLAKEGEELNKRFFTFHRLARPYIILKWAQTGDGFIAKEDNESKWISNDSSQQLVHKWRTIEDSILVGRATATHDNPRLNNRHWIGRNPIRLVIDPDLTLDRSLFLFDQSQRTYCFNAVKELQDGANLIFAKVGKSTMLEDILSRLYLDGIQSVLIEGGAKTIQSFVDKSLWDEARVFSSSKKFFKGISAPEIKGSLTGKENIDGDELCICHNGTKT